MQRLNKRAKQYGLTILQVPAWPDKKNINSFNSDLVIWEPSSHTIMYLFTYDYLWMSLGFTLIDKFPSKRNYIHDSGVAFIQVDRK